MTEVIDLEARRKKKEQPTEELSPETKAKVEAARVDIGVFITNMVSMGVGYICTNFVQDGVVYHLHLEAVAEEGPLSPQKGA